MEERIRRWRGFTERQRERSLVEVFEKWQVEGEIPNEVIVPVLRAASKDSHLPPIPIRTTGTKQFSRRLPSVHEWLASAIVGVGDDEREQI